MHLRWEQPAPSVGGTQGPFQLRVFGGLLGSDGVLTPLGLSWLSGWARSPLIQAEFIIQGQQNPSEVRCAKAKCPRLSMTRPSAAPHVQM